MVLFNFLTFDDISDIGFSVEAVYCIVKYDFYCEFVRFRLLVVENQDYFCSEKMLMSWEIC